MALPRWAALLLAGVVLVVLGSVIADAGVLSVVGIILVAAGAIVLAADLVGGR